MAPEELDETLRAKRLSLPATVREWYLLAARWDQGGLNVWIRPSSLETYDGLIGILTDTEGINLWSVRVADHDIEDPPVVSEEGIPNNSDAFPSFSKFVAAMIVNDVLFAGQSTGEAPELDRDSARAALTRFVSSRSGDYFADAPLESATVVMFAYPNGGPVFGKSRTSAGHELLQRLRKPTA